MRYLSLILLGLAACGGPVPATIGIEETGIETDETDTDTGSDTDGDTDPEVDPLTVDDDGDGYSELDGDCDDTQPSMNPVSTDLVGDGYDQNCDGVDGSDGDGDGHANAISGGDDCDDEDLYTFPGAIEIWYDGKAQGCEVGPDEAWDDGDQDGDGRDSDFVGGDDCVDTNEDIRPDGVETNGNGIDDNCNGLVDQFSVTIEWDAASDVNYTVTVTDMPANKGYQYGNIRVSDTEGRVTSDSNTVYLDETTTLFSSHTSGAGGDIEEPAADQTWMMTITETFECWVWGYDPEGVDPGGTCHRADPTL